ncbi:hypothetical protein Q4E93_30455 [Flavitalea sp. BT771]|uniref:DUF4175 family protein n=1 Tax=Flavitalea sp. BT771 TaxID=3063329 RepID=UPI0026E148F3|nr:DUF4175 family protein [Flavitalea sp. BT771]MDO6434975.1 hypothetical protein [Flavitalea sp. BT771]MDV6223875.1 DUF4175 family protein [Flavitalea sp. BT771]
MTQGLVFCGLLSLAVSLLLMAVLARWGYGSLWYGAVFFIVVYGITLWLFPSWRVTVVDIARILDKRLPDLEESCGLLLRPVEALGALERLQAERVRERLHAQRLPQPLQKKLIMGVCLVGAMVWVSMAVRKDKAKEAHIAVRAMPEAKVVAGVKAVNIRVMPPAYTGRGVRSQQDLNLQVEEGALVNWEIQTNMPVEAMQLIFNDSIRVRLKAADTGHTLWRTSGVAGLSGFYQLKMNDGLSELYKMEVVRDEAPKISIRTPKAYLIVDFGESRKIPLAVRVQDDYGVSDATIVATVASGSGEAVRFKEQVLPFGRALWGGRAAVDLMQTLDLDALGLHPGDELYFYCRAKDNHGQEARSDMYIISLPDTAKLMSLEGLTTGVDVKPEFFRSERQIIIETERLLREKDTMTVQAFNNKCNDLGIDQKLLRLRYGKFLGEEAEEGGNGESFSRAGGAPGDFGNAAKVLDAFTDKHDNAEDATYFEPAIKQQLKATLTEMWNAELRLRTFKPLEALPYEYKALRLLKDLQQKSRAYVAKTGVRVTPLDPKKRLTGKLDEILTPRQHVVSGQEPSAEDKLRMALSVLDGGSFSGPAMGILQEASRQLGKKAMDKPGEYLKGFQAMRRVLAGGEEEGGDRQLAQRAIRKLVSLPEASPSRRPGPPDAGLSQLYFSNVNKP